MQEPFLQSFTKLAAGVWEMLFKDIVDNVRRTTKTDRRRTPGDHYSSGKVKNKYFFFHCIKLPESALKFSFSFVSIFLITFLSKVASDK